MVRTGLHQKIWSHPLISGRPNRSIHLKDSRTRLYREEEYTTFIGLFGSDGARICKSQSNTNVRLIRIMCLHHKRSIKMVKRLSNWAVLTQLPWANSNFERSKLQPTYSDLANIIRGKISNPKDDSDELAMLHGLHMGYYELLEPGVPKTQGFNWHPPVFGHTGAVEDWFTTCLNGTQWDGPRCPPFSVWWGIKWCRHGFYRLVLGAEGHTDSPPFLVLEAIRLPPPIS